MLRVAHFAAAEPDGDFYLVAVLQKALGVTHFCVKIVGVDVERQTNLLDFHNALILTGFLLTLCLLETELAVVDDFANRRLRRRCNFYQVQVTGIGLFQCLSLIPGTSRSGATIIGAMLLGCSRPVAAEFSFFLGIPVMFGASLLKILKHGLAFSGQQWIILLLGMAVSFVVALYAVKFLMEYVRKNNFAVFGYYRIVLGVIVLIYFGVRAIAGI